MEGGQMRAITLASAAACSTSLAKVIHVDWRAKWPMIKRVEPAPQVFKHRFRRRSFTDLTQLLSILRGAAIGGEMAVRGVPVAEVGRRAHHDDPEKGPAGLRVEPQWWFACDWDTLAFPDGSDNDPLLHPAALAELATPWLPPDARDKSMIVQISASAGYKPGARFRTYHLTDKPLTGANTKLWLKPAIDRRKLDPVLYVESQPHYLATTMIGGPDPCPERFSLVRRPSGEIVPTTGFDRCKAKHEREAALEQERRDKIAFAIQARGIPDDGRALEIAIRKSEVAIARSASGSRHPTYTTETARIRAIIERHGGDWPAARERLRTAYLGTLSTKEAAERAKGSTDGVLHWVEDRA
jgi:hypothetical protein